jgi:hypothetical protein
MEFSYAAFHLEYMLAFYEGGVNSASFKKAHRPFRFGRLKLSEWYNPALIEKNVFGRESLPRA